MRLRCVSIALMIITFIGRKIRAGCVIKNETVIECRCVGNEEFRLPESLDYTKINSVLVTSCVTANLNFSSFDKSKDIKAIVVQNISGHLALGRLVKTRNLQEFKLLRIKRVNLMKHDTFASVFSIENFHLEDTRIENFEEQFTSTNVMCMTLKNVTIDRMIGINFSERGKSLIIHDTLIRNIQTSLNFAFFSKVEIRNSEFELEKPGHVSIEGNSALVSNSVFTNVSMNLVASSDITINGSCADGKSSLRLSANRIESFDNRLPTEIVYTRNSAMPEVDNDFPLIVNNTVCIAGNCKCPKSAGHNSYERFHANVYLGVLLLVLVPGLF